MGNISSRIYYHTDPRRIFRNIYSSLNVRSKLYIFKMCCVIIVTPTNGAADITGNVPVAVWHYQMPVAPI